MKTRIIEINGIKMELDARSGKVSRIDTLKIGTKVKLLRKQYGDSFSVNIGVVIGLDEFKVLPTIQIAYLNTGYGSKPVEFFSFNAKTTDAEMLIAEDGDLLEFSKDEMLRLLDKDIAEKELAAKVATQARDLFLKHFGEIVNLTEKEPT